MPQQVKPQSRAAQQLKPAAVAQLKDAAPAPSAKKPVAPPAYRPQHAPKVLQTKMLAPQQPVSRPQTPPSAAQPLESPQAFRKVLQMKSNITAPTRQSKANPTRGLSAHGIVGSPLRKASGGAIQLSAPPLPTPAPAPIVFAAPAPAVLPAAPAVAVKSEAQVQAAIEFEFTLWAKALKAGTDPSKSWNTGFNGQGGQNENVSKADYDKLVVWWKAKKDKVNVLLQSPINIPGMPAKMITTFPQKDVTYSFAVSSKWDRVSKDALCDFLAQVSAGGGFNFHINVIGYKP